MRRFEALLVGVGYAALSFAYFGWQFLPHPGNAIAQGNDVDMAVWSFAWFVHALSIGANPMVSHAVYAPVGVNLAWTPAVPGLAFVFMPLTALAGPVIAVNVASLLAPAAAAWTAYLLCRYLTGSLWASIIGGYLFGFSDAVARQLAPGHLNLSMVFLLPLVALFTVRYVRRDLTGWGLSWRLGLTLGFQLTISTEFALMALVGLVGGLLLAYAFEAQFRRRLRSSVGPIVVGGVLSLVFAAPFTYYLLFHFESATVDPHIKEWGTDLAAALFPNPLVGVGGDQSWLTSQVSSRSVYLGLPTLIIIVLYGIRSWRSPAGRLLLSALLGAYLITLGATLQIYGHTLLTLPWWTAAMHVPGLNDALPFRFGLLVSLAACVIVATWIASVPGRVFRRPYVLPVLAVVAIVPVVWTAGSSFNQRPINQPSFFTTGLDKSCLAPGETVMVFADSGDTLLWQAQSGFRFNLASGGLQPFPEFGKPLNSFDDDPIVWDLEFASGWANPTMGRLLAFASTHRVDRVVTIEPSDYPSRRQMRVFGKTEDVADAIVSPGCQDPPLTRRNLTKYVQEWEVDPQPYQKRSLLGFCDGAGMQLLPTGLTPISSSGLRIANYVAGKGITCSNPPAGYRRRGYASAANDVPGGIYPYYADPPAPNGS